MEDMRMSHEQWGCASVMPHRFRVKALNGEGWSDYSLKVKYETQKECLKWSLDSYCCYH